jgi:hypothetical protein
MQRTQPQPSPDKNAHHSGAPTSDTSPESLEELHLPKIGLPTVELPDIASIDPSQVTLPQISQIFVNLRDAALQIGERVSQFYSATEDLRLESEEYSNSALKKVEDSAVKGERQDREQIQSLNEAQKLDLKKTFNQFVELIKTAHDSGLILPTVLKIDESTLHRYFDLGETPGFIDFAKVPGSGISDSNLEYRTTAKESTFYYDNPTSGYDMVDFVPRLRYIELPLGNLTRDEINSVIKDQSLCAFLEAVETTIPNCLYEPGSRFDWGSSSHHSGEIEGDLFVLKDGYVALIVTYSSNERRGGSCYSEGKFRVEKIREYMPEWSAKRESWDGNDEFEPLTPDDEAAIREVFREYEGEEDSN